MGLGKNIVRKLKNTFIQTQMIAKMKRKIILKNTILRIIICMLAFNSIGEASVQPKKTASFQIDAFAILKGYKRVRILRGKDGELLGYIYVNENGKYTNGVLSVLLVVKEKGTGLDTLYRIDSKGFFNSQGKIELKNHAKNYYGFKLHPELKRNTDLFSVGDVNNKGKMESDDNDFLIDWNYKNKTFGYDPAP